MILLKNEKGNGMIHILFFCVMFYFLLRNNSIKGLIHIKSEDQEVHLVRKSILVKEALSRLCLIDGSNLRNSYLKSFETSQIPGRKLTLEFLKCCCHNSTWMFRILGALDY